MGCNADGQLDSSVAPLIEEGESAELILEPSQRSRTRPSAATLLLLGLFGATVCITMWQREEPTRNVTRLVTLEEEEALDEGTDGEGTDEKKKNTEPAEPLTCAGENEGCLDSKCCVAGGADGLQCYAKNADYAACAPSCEKGVHEPEEEGEWGADGVFKKAEWSCEKLGKKSEPGCETFNSSKAKCPKSYCMWKGDSCLPTCSSLGTPDGCWNSQHCMWEDETCMDACWDFSSEKSCQPGDKCVWANEKCQMGWWLFDSAETCPGELGYMWNGTCVQDPCSAPGEDCTNTQCCSTERGASGMTCFTKDANYASCKETCESDDEWNCTQLGERAKYSAGCAFAGKTCETEKLCCNRGFVCAKKDDLWTACVQTVKQTTWVTQKIPIPEDWDGTVFGAGRDEYEMAQAGPEDPKLGTTLYCFMAFLPGSYEEELVNIARDLNASIFGCDGSDLYNTWESANGAWDTGEATLANTDVFIKVWQQVAERGDFINYDWTVKVDPDCVMAPVRLRDHLAALNAPEWAPVYVKNNGMDPGLGNNGFLGAIEVFSKKAVLVYLDNQDGCLESLGLDAGEDGYFKGCMDALGVGYMLDEDMFFPDFAAGACANAARAAFHPLKEPDEWKHCWNILLGNEEW